jgi:hypothetical protein
MTDTFHITEHPLPARIRNYKSVDESTAIKPVSPDTRLEAAVPEVDASELLKAKPGYPIRPAVPVEFDLDIGQFLEKYSGLPPQTIAIGMSADGSPVLFDLSDPSLGAILVLAEHNESSLAFLRLILHSAMNVHAPFKTLIISSQPDIWEVEVKPFISAGKCLGCYGVDDSQSGAWVMRLAKRVEQRYKGRRNGAPVIMLVDDLSFLTRADSDVRLNFEWLLSNGPQMGVWIVVALTTSNAMLVGRWVRFFHTRILGKMPAKAALRLGMYAGLQSDRLVEQRQYAVHIQDTWLTFWLPDLNSKSMRIELSVNSEV